MDILNLRNDNAFFAWIGIIVFAVLLLWIFFYSLMRNHRKTLFWSIMAIVGYCVGWLLWILFGETFAKLAISILNIDIINRYKNDFSYIIAHVPGIPFAFFLVFVVVWYLISVLVYFLFARKHLIIRKHVLDGVDSYEPDTDNHIAAARIRASVKRNRGGQFQTNGFKRFVFALFCLVLYVPAVYTFSANIDALVSSTALSRKNSITRNFAEAFGFADSPFLYTMPNDLRLTVDLGAEILNDNGEDLTTAVKEFGEASIALGDFSGIQDLENADFEELKNNADLTQIYDAADLNAKLIEYLNAYPTFGTLSDFINYVKLDTRNGVISTIGESIQNALDAIADLPTGLINNTLHNMFEFDSATNQWNLKIFNLLNREINESGSTLKGLLDRTFLPKYMTNVLQRGFDVALAEGSIQPFGGIDDILSVSFPDINSIFSNLSTLIASFNFSTFLAAFDTFDSQYIWPTVVTPENAYGAADYLNAINSGFITTQLASLKAVVDDAIDFEGTTVGSFINQLFTDGYTITYNGNTEVYRVVSDANRILIPKDTYQVFDNVLFSDRIFNIKNPENKAIIKNIFSSMFKVLSRNEIIDILYP